MHILGLLEVAMGIFHYDKSMNQENIHQIHV